MDDLINNILHAISDSSNNSPTPESVTILTSALESGWNPNTSLRDSKDPLLVLVASNPQLVKLLLTHGADPNLPGTITSSRRASKPNPKTALNVAVRSGAVESVKLLLEAGAADAVSLYYSLYIKDVGKHVEMLETLLEGGLKKYVNETQPLPNIDVHRYDSVLQAALYVGGYGLEEKVRLLLNAGADVEVDAFNEEVGVTDWAKNELGEDSGVYKLLKGALEKKVGVTEERSV